MDKFSVFMTTGTLDIEFTRLFKLALRLSEFQVVSSVIVQGVGAARNFTGGKVQGSDFLNKDELDILIRQSDLIISHCGIGSIVNSVLLHKPTVLVPRREIYGEHFDDHQMQIYEKMAYNPLFLCIDEEIIDVGKVIRFISDFDFSLIDNSAPILNESLMHEVYSFFQDSY